MANIQKLILPFSVICILSLLLVVMQNWRKSPDNFNSWECAAVTIIEEEKKREILLFNIIDPATSDIVTQLAGSTDLVCEPPRLFIWDVNEDGTEDLYFQHCGGHGYLYCDGQTVSYKILPDTDVSFKGFWYRLFYNYNSRMIGLISLCSASIALIVIISIRIGRYRRSPFTKIGGNQN